MAHSPTSTAYLVYGPTAAGKSTVARQLAAEHNAVRFAIDEWMHALFGPDRPETMDMAWVMPRVARCQARIWTRRQRVQQRNLERGETYSFPITPAMFDAMEPVFERPGADELRRSRVFSEESAHV